MGIFNEAMLKLVKIVVLTILCCFMGSCFHLQTQDAYPANLKNLYFTSDNVYNEISQNLQSKLRAMGVHFTESKNAAPFTLALSDSKTSTILPTAYSTSSATAYIYTLTVTATLLMQKNKKKLTVFQTPLVATQSVTLNVNQVGSSAITPLMRRTLTRQIVNSIYYLLISKGTQHTIISLNQPQRKH
ncbi:MAG: hypothetical protein A3F10_02295 [Coxiella sp. RIFCSPHIGHO2_12_FULL_42_15]|nr:MAG: hypothetical protein A3F10_02295 [Coxiella sp. RIFCSPHIGHO2_12_FULL_42_15]